MKNISIYSNAVTKYKVQTIYAQLLSKIEKYVTVMSLEMFMRNQVETEDYPISSQ